MGVDNNVIMIYDYLFLEAITHLILSDYTTNIRQLLVQAM